MAFDAARDITWLGHDGFALQSGGLTIVIDPYKLTRAIKADILLITHSHYDHCSVDDIPSVLQAGAIVITDAESAAAMAQKGISADIRCVKPGDEMEVKGVRIEVVPAYNVGKKFHPKKKSLLGFIVTLDGCRIYHAGDTDLIEEMAGFNADIALLPVSGTYVMTAGEAVEAAKRIKPKVAIPMHYGTIIGSEQDALQFRNGLAGVCEVLLPVKN